MAGAEETTPGFFRSDKSSSFLYDALISAPQIDAVYASFENGFHRVVTRVDDDRRRSDARIPANARWHMSFIDDFSAGADRKRHRTFYETWPTPLSRYSISAANNDLRVTVPQYQLARQSLDLVVTDPFINPDTGHAVIGVGYPILVEENFVGVASAHITLRGLSELLTKHRASPNSITVIADEHGDLLAHPVSTKAVQSLDGRMQVPGWADAGDPQIVEAVRRRAAGSPDRFTFRLAPENAEYVALFSQIPTGSGKIWQVLVVTPTADFVGELERTNRLLICLMLALVVIESAHSWARIEPDRDGCRYHETHPFLVVRGANAGAIPHQRDCGTAASDEAAGQCASVICDVCSYWNRAQPDRLRPADSAWRGTTLHDDLFRGRGELHGHR
jgi:hypothetical protein